MSFIAGAYTATMESDSVGQIQDGIGISHRYTTEDIIGDNYANTVQDAVFLGVPEMRGRFVLMEYNAVGAVNTFWSMNSAAFLTQPTVGTLMLATATEFLMSAVAGTPAANTPATLRFPKSHLAPDYPVEILFSPRLRTIPIELRFLAESGVFGSVT